MPVYTYNCDDCGEYELLRTIAERNHPAACPVCAGFGLRVIEAPNLALMNPGIRRAVGINERSRHEPRVSQPGSGGHVHTHACGSGCGIGKSIRNKRMVKTKLGELQGQKKGARPWMLGH